MSYDLTLVVFQQVKNFSKDYTHREWFFGLKCASLVFAGKAKNLVIAALRVNFLTKSAITMVVQFGRKAIHAEYAKYTVGESLKKETIELILTIYRANRTVDRTAIIEQAREHIEVIRLLVRLMKDLHQLSLSAFIQLNDKIENVSKQLSGWQKSVKK